MPVVIRNLVINAEIGKEKSASASRKGSSSKANAIAMKTRLGEDLADQIMQAIQDQKER